MTFSIRSMAPLLVAACCGLGASSVSLAQTPKKLAIGMSTWTGVAPLTLADRAGIFKKNGLDVELKLIPQMERHTALANGTIQCASTPVETHVQWNANGVPSTQIFVLDKFLGAEGLAVRHGVRSVADLKGKTIGVDAHGTTPYFGLAWVLHKNGLSMKDVKTVPMAPQAALHAFVAGQNDAAVTYEPYLSTVLLNPHAGKILSTTMDSPMIMNTMGCDPKWLKAHPAAAKALTQSYFDALDLIKSDHDKAFDIMGGAVQKTREAFAKSASLLRWQDRAANQRFFNGELQSFMKASVPVLLEAGMIRQAPADLDAMVDASFVKP